jgi:hypothetical protein
VCLCRMKRKRQFKKTLPNGRHSGQVAARVMSSQPRGDQLLWRRGRMFLSKITIENFRCFGEGANRFELPFRRGLTALVGENEAGKTAVVDALRFALRAPRRSSAAESCPAAAIAANRRCANPVDRWPVENHDCREGANRHASGATTPRGDCLPVLRTGS